MPKLRTIRQIEYYCDAQCKVGLCSRSDEKGTLFTHDFEKNQPRYCLENNRILGWIRLDPYKEKDGIYDYEGNFSEKRGRLPVHRIGRLVSITFVDGQKLSFIKEYKHLYVDSSGFKLFIR